MSNHLPFAIASVKLMASDVRKRARPHDSVPDEGRKRRRDAEVVAVAADAVDVAMDRGRAMRVPSETVQYFEEISGALDQATAKKAEVPLTVEEAETDQQAMLVSGALAEAEGQQVALALDAVCSRVLQRLLAVASAKEQLAFARALAGKALEVVTSPFGSHVLETLCETLRAGCAAEGESVDAEQVAAALQPLCDELAPHAARLAVHPAASPALRVILSCLSGRDVRPGNAKGQLEHVAEAGDPSARAPKPLRRFTAALMTALESGGEDYWFMCTSPAASALLQSLCLAHAGFPRDLDALLPRILGARCTASPATGAAEPALANVPKDALLHIACDAAGSRLLECVLRLASPPLRRELATHVFIGQMPALAEHPCGNFTLQAYLRSLREPRQDAAPLSEALSELAPCMAALMQHSRGGVLVALLDACARIKTCERDAARALTKALAEAYSSGTEAAAVDNGEEAQQARAPMDAKNGRYLQDLAPPLLRLVSGGTSKGGFSHQGCAILTAALSLAPPAGRTFADSLAALPQGEALSAAQDASASRCVEAVLRGASGNAPPGVARKLATTLAGSWASLGRHPVASHVVDAAFDGGDMRTREGIVTALASIIPSLAAQRHGPALMARLGVSEFKRDAEAWKRRHLNAAKVRNAFVDILRDTEPEPQLQSVGTRVRSAGAPKRVPLRGSEPRAKSATSVAELSKEVQRALAGLTRR